MAAHLKEDQSTSISTTLDYKIKGTILRLLKMLLFTIEKKKKCIQCMCSNDPTFPPSHKDFWFEPYVYHPSRISSVALYFPLKSLEYEIPHPLRIPNDFLWRRYGCFLGLHNIHTVYIA